ncbi:hypothetical protein QBC38DRAFT_371275, partial [Podospora fimiseda]
RKVLITPKRFLVLGPRITQPGDLVCIIAGSPTPHVLRSVRLGNGEVVGEQQEERYQLVGDAYVYGMMRGEALERPDFRLEDIVLV